MLVVEMAASPDSLAVGPAAMLFVRCPVDIEDVAEAYCLRRLEPALARAFENHYLVCPDCARTVADVSDFVDAFRIAAKAS